MGRFFETASSVVLVVVAAAAASTHIMSFAEGQTITAEEKPVKVGFMNIAKADEQGEMLVSALETDGLLQGERGVWCIWKKLIPNHYYKTR